MDKYQPKTFGESISHNQINRTFLKHQETKKLLLDFESLAMRLEGTEFWSARELCSLFGYIKCYTFMEVIEQAKTACHSVGYNVKDHFADIDQVNHPPSKERWACKGPYFVRGGLAQVPCFLHGALAKAPRLIGLSASGTTLRANV